MNARPLAGIRLLGGRPLGFVARNAVRPANWRALPAAFRRYPRPLQGLSRYFLARGDYPVAWPVRTPAGVVWPTLYSSHDFITVNEIFCREDYALESRPALVVDIGSNIGISALYFLTRHPDVRCILFEPVPQNAERLRANLEAFEERYELREEAVADRSGDMPFAVEPTGRYGGLDRDLAAGSTITVRCRNVNDVLEDILADVPRIDVLKIDAEGSEAATLRAIRPDLARRIGRIYAELEDEVVDVPGFDLRVECDTARYESRGFDAADHLRSVR